MNSKNILIIDDSNTNLVLLEVIFQEKGFEVNTAFGAKEALKMIELKKPDLILLDILMPHMSGDQFLEKLRSNNKFKDIPVIIISAISDAAIIKKVNDLGIVDYIMKPVDIDYLENKVDKLFNFTEINK